VSKWAFSDETSEWSLALGLLGVGAKIWACITPKRSCRPFRRSTYAMVALQVTAALVQPR
jgi:hypothetical protein